MLGSLRNALWQVSVRCGLMLVLGALVVPFVARPVGAAAQPSIAIGDVVVPEGDAGTNPARLTVTLTSPLATDTLITYTTLDGTATSGGDYIARTGKVRIRARHVFATISIKTIGDTELELDQSFSVTLTGAGGIPISDPTGSVTIRDDDPATTGRLAIGDATAYEGDASKIPLRFTVTLDAPSSVDVTARYATVGGSATSGVDFVARTGKLKIRAGKTSAILAVKEIGDATYEGTKQFTVVLSSVVGATVDDDTATGTIIDDDAPPISAPGTPTLTSAVAGPADAMLVVAWDPPTSDGGSSVTSYEVETTRPADVIVDTSTGTAANVVCGSPGITCTMRVRAVNTVGPGPWSAPISGTTWSTPSAPTLTSATAGPANGMLVVAWDPPSSDGGTALINYELEITRPAGVIVGTYTVLGVNIVCGSPGITCTMRVRAVNGAGAGPWSDPMNGTTWRAPSAVDLTVVGGNQSVAASWPVPVDAGDFPVLDYRVERSTDGTNFSFVAFTSVRAATVSCPGEHSTCWVRVQARNAAGLSVAAQASATTWARPTAPTLTSVRRVGSSVGLNWMPPADDGGAPVFDYTGERTIDGGTTWIPIGSIQFTLGTCPIGTSCGFRISAVNIVATSPPSNELYVGP